MTLAAIELNDQSLLIQAEDDTRYAEPGFARLTADGIVTGQQARAVAWREPQHTYNQYWCHLNQTPLANRHRFARHHGDIAFAQLRSLWRQAGEPDSLFLLVPGSFTRAELSLLLGLVKAIPAQPAAIIDSALAACQDAEEQTLHVDMHLHETVLTVCRPEGGSIRIVDQEIFPGFGMVQIENSVARHISDILIESYRFDPLHSSETEQTIYDQIPHWLTRLRFENDVSVKLESDQGELPCILGRDAVRRLISERLGNVRVFLEEWTGCSLLLSNPSGVLAGLMDDFESTRVARRSAGTRRVIERCEDILEQVDELYRVRELRRGEPVETPETVNGEPLATHLLCGDLALPLDTPVSIQLAENGPRMSNEIDRDAALTVVLRDRSLETLHGAADGALPRVCRPGETIRIGGHELKLIRVSNS